MLRASALFSVCDDDDGNVSKEKPSNLVVSDLDGTMVGDDQSTLEFWTFWEEEERALIMMRKVKVN